MYFTYDFFGSDVWRSVDFYGRRESLIISKIFGFRSFYIRDFQKIREMGRSMYKLFCKKNENDLENCEMTRMHSEKFD